MLERRREFDVSIRNSENIDEEMNVDIDEEMNVDIDEDINIKIQNTAFG